MSAASDVDPGSILYAEKNISAYDKGSYKPRTCRLNLW
jgi:hypothetical protein